MQKIIVAFSAVMLLSGLSGTASSAPSQSEAYSICVKEVQRKVGVYTGSDPGLKKHMQKYIENCMVQFGYEPEE